jgi:hypothetical protein
MNDPRGSLKVKANGKDYTLWMGMSVLADMQTKHGQDVLERLEPPEGAGQNWAPDMNIILDLVRGSLARFHSEEIDADKYLADDILSENKNIFPRLMSATFPDQKAPSSGNARRPKRAAST